MVKIQYPGVEETVEQDLRNLKALLQTFAMIGRDVDALEARRARRLEGEGEAVRRLRQREGAGDRRIAAEEQASRHEIGEQPKAAPQCGIIQEEA